MTVITDSDVMMAAFLPRIHMVLHDVAIDAGLWVIAEVTRTLSVPKRKCAYPNKNSNQDGENRQAAMPKLSSS